MSERRCDVPEERWVDLLGARLSSREKDALLAHKDGCAACQTVYGQWAALLGGERGGPTPDERGGPAAAGRYAARRPGALRAAADRHAARSDALRAAIGGADTALSATRRLSLRSRAAAYAFARRTSAALRNAFKRPAIAAVCGLGAAVAVLLMLLYPFARGGTAPGGSLSPAGYAMLHEPDGAAVMNQPDTVIYSSDSGSRSAAADGWARSALPPGARETLWLNVRTHELFLLMEGLLPSDRTDMQAWAQTGGKSANLGLLRFHDTRAHLYSANVRPEEWEALLLTVEPKGGSPMPTEPETASIRLKAPAGASGTSSD
ncbi:anti-sigma factor [Cohnella sp. 56]|uniref:anti-sigma factor n=1 Tax=Cohnella sp. 56 TaxID=3113722 RepID=UPI0030E8E036